MTNPNCDRCGGLGHYPVQDGPEDFDTVECGCNRIPDKFDESEAFKNTVEIMGRINQAIYGVNPFKGV